MDEYERVLLVKPDVFIYRIPPRTSNRGYRASDWKLDEPDWTGRLRVVAKGRNCILKLEEKSSGQLFAQCPVDKYPGVAVESVSDSSRYFVLKIMSDSGQSAFIGIGFADRGDSFDLNVALQDHFKTIEKEDEAEKETADESAPKLDLKFKEGQTIKVNLNIAKKSGSRLRDKKSLATGVLLPPPPSSSSSNPSSRSGSLTGGDGAPASRTAAEEHADSDVADQMNVLSLSGQQQKSSDLSSSSSSSAATGWAQFS